MNDPGGIFSWLMLMVYVQGNMATISKVGMFLLSIMMLLFSATHSIVLEPDENHIKSATFFLKKLKWDQEKLQ